MSFTYRYDQQVGLLAQRIRQADLRLLVVDETTQLDKRGFSLLHTLISRTGCPCVLISGKPGFLMRSQFLFLRCMFLFWSRKGKRHV